jgi:hypothetical protein
MLNFHFQYVDYLGLKWALLISKNPDSVGEYRPAEIGNPTTTSPPETDTVLLSEH